uniref:Uncharacterized protein n=1 Tax=Kalanchoe fedtschenkoi TaxID=63787 RepID=A0A7N1A5E6_KALFE
MRFSWSLFDVAFLGANYTRNGTYQGNLNALLSSLSSEKDIHYGFYNFSVGDGFDRAYAIALCRGDIGQTACQRCVSFSTADLPRRCPTQEEVIVWRRERQSSEHHYWHRLHSMQCDADYLHIYLSQRERSDKVRNIIIGILIIYIFIFLKVRKKKEEGQNNFLLIYAHDDITSTECLQFKFETIQVATDNFKKDNKLGQGGFGSGCRANLLKGPEIAGDFEFKNEIVIVAKLQHRKLVRLLGFCLEGNERLLIYEFVPNSSLYRFLFGVCSIFTNEMCPKIVDFGMARLFTMNQTQGDTNRIVGTYGYMAPEYAMHGKFSVKSDMYNFGTLLLETISRFCIGGVPYELTSFAWESWKARTATRLIDPTILNGRENDILRIIHIGLLCVQDSISARPTMASVIYMLNSPLLFLPLPSKPTYLASIESEAIMTSVPTSEVGTLLVNEFSIADQLPR